MNDVLIRIAEILLGGTVTSILTLRFTRKKASAEAYSKEIDNNRNLIENFKSYIVEPLKTEVNGLRKDVRRLAGAIEKSKECPHFDNCPVIRELQKSEHPDNSTNKQQ